MSRAGSALFVRRSKLVPEDLLGLFAASPEAERFYWEHPDRDEAVLGLGAAAVIESTGSFENVAREARQLWARLHVLGEAPAFVQPRLVGGFAFDPAAPGSGLWRGFPAVRLVLPSLLVVRRGAEAGCVWIQSGDHPGSRRTGSSTTGVGESDAPQPVHGFHVRPDRPRSAYCALVSRAIEAIRGGNLEKVVVARSCGVEGSEDFDAARLLRTLRSQHATCTLFAVARDGTTFLGATPESLVRLEGERVFTAAVAGSAPRGRTPEEDRAFACALRESKKDQEEHVLVVQALREGLAAHCVEISVPESPQLLHTHGIHHLHTPITARLRAPDCLSILDVAQELHPTPAVGGTPTPAALEWLRSHESLDRGWYAGLVGWIGPDGGGELSVALRCALLRGRQATLFAGAGVVGRSDPEAEFDETRLKLLPLLDALVEI